MESLDASSGEVVDGLLSDLEHGQSALPMNPGEVAGFIWLVYLLIAHFRSVIIAAKTPAKQRKIKISGVVDKLCLHAYELGLSSSPLGTLVDIITLPNELDQASLGSLIRNLYPAGKVSDDIVVKVVASLGHGKAKPNFNVQAALIKWLVMVYDVLQNAKVLSQLYSILFNLLGTLALRCVPRFPSHLPSSFIKMRTNTTPRAPLCHLLSLITRRKHVRSYRIQVL